MQSISDHKSEDSRSLTTASAMHKPGVDESNNVQSPLFLGLFQISPESRRYWSVEKKVSLLTVRVRMTFHNKPPQRQHSIVVGFCGKAKGNASHLALVCVAYEGDRETETEERCSRVLGQICFLPRLDILVLWYQAGPVLVSPASSSSLGDFSFTCQQALAGVGSHTVQENGNRGPDRRIRGSSCPDKFQDITIGHRVHAFFCWENLSVYKHF